MSLIVNMFGGPSVGKSTTAAKVFASLKDLGVNVELATEFAKDLTWEGAHKSLHCQPFITGTQIWRIERLAQAGVAVIVTDSPPLMGAAYAKDWPGVSEMVGNYHFKHPSLNFQLTRVKPFSQHGRLHSEDESKELDLQIGWLLDHWAVNPWVIPGNSDGAEQAVRKIMEYV